MRDAKLFGLIAHGSPGDLAELSTLAAARGWKAFHAQGPQGDELMMVVPADGEPGAARAFVVSVEGGRFPAVRFETMLLPRRAQPQPQSGPQPFSAGRPSS